MAFYVYTCTLIVIISPLLFLLFFSTPERRFFQIFLSPRLSSYFKKRDKEKSTKFQSTSFLQLPSYEFIQLYTGILDDPSALSMLIRLNLRARKNSWREQKRSKKSLALYACVRRGKVFGSVSIGPYFSMPIGSFLRSTFADCAFSTFSQHRVIKSNSLNIFNVSFFFLSPSES